MTHLAEIDGILTEYRVVLQHAQGLTERLRVELDIQGFWRVRTTDTDELWIRRDRYHDWDLAFINADPDEGGISVARRVLDPDDYRVVPLLVEGAG